MRASLWRAGGSTRPAALRLRQERSLGTGRPHLERPSKEAVQEFVDRIRLVGSGQVELRRWSHDHRVLEMVLRNGRRKNSLTGRMMVEMRDFAHALAGPAHKDAAALIIRGEGKSFCSGADFELAQSLQTGAEGALMCELMTSTLTSIRRLPLISIALLEGFAMGGGAELATAADFRVMSELGGRMQFVQVKMGVSTGWGGGSRLVKLVGRRQALRLLGTAMPVDATQALQLGLVDDVVPAGVDADAHVAAFLKPFLKASHATEALRAIKQGIAAADDSTLDDAREEEALAFQSVWGGPANLRAIQAATERAAQASAHKEKHRGDKGA